MTEDFRPSDELPEDALSAYLDGELDPAARAAVEARLETSPEWRAVLADVRSAREAVRGLPVAEAPDGFWDRVYEAVREPDAVAADATTVVDLEGARTRRDPTRSRWVAALGGAAAAAVVAAVLIAPSPSRVKPALASLSNAHAVRSSASQDSVSTLAPVGVVAGFRR